MKYIGIDLGTTNSAISSFDGENTHIFKSPEQYDVTPSAIYFDKRGNKYVGSRAYNSASRSPDNAALLFKRFMGTSTKVKIPAIGKEFTPEECSAEVLRALYGYLPEDIRGETGTVITVPAAFNQMQKDATMQAANLANIGQVALMQEPVAAVMSVMKNKNSDGIFLIYDLGGGTFDIAIAESIKGKVNLLRHGGISMCGGRDFDRALLDNICKPWLLENFNLPSDFAVNPQFRNLMRMVAWAAEKAKIELSSKEEAIISLPESELNMRDLDGEEIYVDISVSRKDYEPLINDKIEATINATREALEEARLSANDIERIVFVGGPTQYKPLRDMVASELAVPASTDVNPMTAVSEGAAIFAESIDWSSQSRGRKSTKGSTNVGANVDLSFDYIARTTENSAKIVAKTTTELNGYELQIDDVQTGWTSGKVELKNGVSLRLPLSKSGDNEFSVFVFDNSGKSISLKNSSIVITKTAASIQAIPASSSIGVAVKNGSVDELDFWVKKGDSLPAKGRKIYKATETLKAGSAERPIVFQLWEGEISEPASDNKFIGVFAIKGTDFDDGVIAAGAELEVSYEMLDSGNIVIEVDVPSIGNSFKSGRNFYSKDTAQIDYQVAKERIQEASSDMLSSVEILEEKVFDERLVDVKHKLDQANTACSENDPESNKQAEDVIQEAKELMAKIKKDHKKEIRQLELDNLIESFEDLKEKAKSSELNKFENLSKSAQRAIDINSNEFDKYLNEMRSISTNILHRQPEFFVYLFKYFESKPHYFNDKNTYNMLMQKGRSALAADDIEALKMVIGGLYDIANFPVSANDDIEKNMVNIMRGN